MSATTEWIDTTLYQVINTYPEYYNYDLFVWDKVKKDAELYYLGAIPKVFELYKNNNVFFTDEDEKSIWLEGTVDDLEWREDVRISNLR